MYLDLWIGKWPCGEAEILACVEYCRPGHHFLDSQMNRQPHTKIENLLPKILPLSAKIISVKSASVPLLSPIGTDNKNA